MIDVEGLLVEYDTWMRSWGASECTRDQRVYFARQRLREWGDPRLGMDPGTIQQLLADPSFSQWTRRTYANHLASWFGWLVIAGHLEVDPMKDVRRGKVPRSVPRPLTPAEAQAALAAATGRNMRTWLLLGLYAGLRAHEIAKIRGEDVGEDEIFVHGKGGKEATIPTHPLIWAAAAGYPRRGYWFPGRRPRASDGPIDAGSVTVRVGRLFDELGIEGSIHRTRHTYATTLLRAGVNLRVVQTLMRHESLATTAAYLAVDEDERTAAVALLQ